jgi:hypothetical protein
VPCWTPHRPGRPEELRAESGATRVRALTNRVRRTARRNARRTRPTPQAACVSVQAAQLASRDGMREARVFRPPHSETVQGQLVVESRRLLDVAEHAAWADDDTARSVRANRTPQRGPAQQVVTRHITTGAAERPESSVRERSSSRFLALDIGHGAENLRRQPRWLAARSGRRFQGLAFQNRAKAQAIATAIADGAPTQVA